MSNSSNRRSAVVVGAGIVGAACALRLRDRGFEVVLIDRGGPGEACSFGNAGRIATSLVTPKSVPGLLRKVPGMLRDPRASAEDEYRFRPPQPALVHPVREVGDPIRGCPHHRRPARPPLARGRGHRPADRSRWRHRRHSDRRCAVRLPEPGAGRGATRRDGRERPARDSRALRVRRPGSRHRAGDSRLGRMRIPQAGGAVRSQSDRAHEKGRRSLHRGRRRSRTRRGRPAGSAGGTRSARALPPGDPRGGQGGDRGRRLVTEARGAPR